MLITRLSADVHRLQLGGTNTHLLNAYVVLDADGVVLVDTGAAGSAEEIAEGLAQLGRRVADVHHLVLTHCHDDHTGSAATIAAASRAVVVAGAADAPVIRGTATGPEPRLSDRERPLLAEVSAGLSPAPPCRVDVEVDGDRELDTAGGLQLLAVPGHTPGSLAVLVPGSRVLLTGDTIAESGGTVVLGPFNTDPDQAWASLQRLAALDVDIACFGHGDPVVGDAAAALRGAVDPWRS